MYNAYLFENLSGEHSDSLLKMSSFAFPDSKAKWIVLGFTTLAAFYVFTKIYNKNQAMRPLTEEEEKILHKYKYQLAAGNGGISVKRNMIRFGDRHLIPYLFPGDDPWKKLPKFKKKAKGANKKGADDHKEQFEKPKIIKVEFPVDVYLRLRPLIKHEIAENQEEIEYDIKTKKKTNKKTNVTTKSKEFILPSVFQKGRDRKLTFTGFQNIIKPGQDNKFAFKTAIEPCIDALLNNGTPCAAFAYGHSGSGKTHTMFGYKNEAGLHRLFANECLERLDKTNMFLEVRLVELYQGKLHDLLCEDKESNEIKLIWTEKRGFTFRQPKSTLCDDGKYRQFPITSVRINNADELEQAITKGVASRQVGDSTVHDQSSRSHAFLEYEIMNDALKSKRRQLIELEADLLWFKLVQDEILHPRVKPEDTSKQFLEAVEKYKDIMKRSELTMEIGRAESTIDMVYAVDFPKIAQEHVAIGKTMVFADLAGNEYGKDASKDETAQEKKEREQINSDLFYLKECIRALHGKNRVSIPYRKSHLTKYLKRYLGEENCKAVMINTIGTSKQMMNQTLNTLKYAKMVANA